MVLISAKAAAALMLADGMEQLTLGQIDARLAAIGYRRDKSAGPCIGLSRWMTGPHAGISHLNCDWRVKEADTGLSAFNADARRDSNFRALQDMRGTVFAVSREKIHTI